MHRQNRLAPQQGLGCLSTAGGYLYSSKQKWTTACFPVLRARLLLVQLNSVPSTPAKQGRLVSAASWDSSWPVRFLSAGAGSGHSSPGHGQPTVNTRRESHGKTWGPGPLGPEQSLIPESLVTADEEKKWPSKVPSLVISVSPAFDFKVLENEGTTPWLSLGFVSCIPDQAAALY